MKNYYITVLIIKQIVKNCFLNILIIKQTMMNYFISILIIKQIMKSCFISILIIEQIMSGCKNITPSLLTFKSIIFCFISSFMSHTKIVFPPSSPL